MMSTVWRAVAAGSTLLFAAGCATGDPVLTVQPREDEVCAVAGPNGQAAITIGDVQVGDQPVQLMRVDPVSGVNLKVVGAALVAGDREVPDGFDTTRVDAGAEGALVVTFELYADLVPAGVPGTATGVSVMLAGSLDGDPHVVRGGPRVRVLPAGGSCVDGS